MGLNRRDFLVGLVGIGVGVTATVGLWGVLQISGHPSEKGLPLTVEQELAKIWPQEFEKDRYPENPAFARYYGKARDAIRTTLNTANRENYDLSRTYEKGTNEDNLQANLRLETRSLVGYVQRDILRYGELVAAEVEDSFLTLFTVKEAFGNHPFHHVLGEPCERTLCVL